MRTVEAVSTTARANGWRGESNRHVLTVSRFRIVLLPVPLVHAGVVDVVAVGAAEHRRRGGSDEGEEEGKEEREEEEHGSTWAGSVKQRGVIGVMI